MKKIARKEAEPGQNSKVCKTLEYSFGDSELDLGIATVTGRFPDHGYAMNEVCRELIYVLEGEGYLYHGKEKTAFAKGDAILILPQEKYYYETEHCVISMTCHPAWSKEQHKMVEE